MSKENQEKIEQICAELDEATNLVKRLQEKYPAANIAVIDNKLIWEVDFDKILEDGN